MAVRRYSAIDVYDKTQTSRFPHMGAYLALKVCPKFTSTSSTKQAATTWPLNELDAAAQTSQKPSSLEGVAVEGTLTETNSVPYG
jgi:hypothetical protein